MCNTREEKMLKVAPRMDNLPTCSSLGCRIGMFLCPHSFNEVAAETDIEGKEKYTARHLFTTGKLPRKRKPREACLIQNLKS